MLEMLGLAQDMLSYALPSGDEAAVLDRALTTLLVDGANRKFADTTRPRPAQQARPGVRGRTAPEQSACRAREKPEAIGGMLSWATRASRYYGVQDDVGSY
jgi:hypothetical protein